MDLGRFGVWTSLRVLGEENAARAARLAEELGFGTLWLGGSPRLPSVRPLLEGSERLTVATGIVNVWNYESAELTAEYHELEGEFPGRLLLGIGVGHPEATSIYEKPLRKMRSFLDGLDADDVPVPNDRRCLAALGPKMLDLSRERSLGTHPYFTPVEHTRFARQHLGPADRRRRPAGDARGDRRPRPRPPRRRRGPRVPADGRRQRHTRGAVACARRRPALTPSLRAARAERHVHPWHGRQVALADGHPSPCRLDHP